MDEIYNDMKTLKKTEIVKFYSDKFKVAENIIEIMYDFLTKAKADDIKRLKKGTYKFKYRIKRNHYENGQTLKGNILTE